VHSADVLAPEVEKYEQIWAHPAYRESPSPGLQNVERFLRTMDPAKNHSLVDIGCGTGAAGLQFEHWGLRVNWVDLTDAALDAGVDRTRFCKAAMWQPQWLQMKRSGWDYAFCCDVLEHLPIEFTMLAVERMLQGCRTAWLQIAFFADGHGAKIGKQLHLTVQPFEWWRDHIAALGKLIDARDLCGHGLFVVQR
jgi:2-polyprenyl-3-methyl-5-hydroxy-6-metoxy-1,4-benzoquinol methylase